MVLGTVELGIDSALFAPEFRLYDCMGAPSGDLVLLGHFVDVNAKEPKGGRVMGLVTMRISLLLALAATLVPSVFTISGSGGFRTPLAEYLSPVLLLATLCVAVIQSLRPTNLESQVLASGDTALREAIDAPLLPDRVTSVTERTDLDDVSYLVVAGLSRRKAHAQVPISTGCPEIGSTWAHVNRPG